MTWFQRYGIPGTYFCGLAILWAASLYHCSVYDILVTDCKAEAMVALVVVFFLPLGYLLSIMQQLAYLLSWRWA